MAYIAPIHRPSSIRHALRIKLLSPEEDSLVIAKVNRIEIWGLKDSHLAMRHSRVIHGTISMIQKLRPKDARTDLLFVGTDRFQYFTLSWNASSSQLETVQYFDDVGEKHMRDSQSQDKCLVDPTGRYMAMHLWEGVLNVLRLFTRGARSTELDWMDQVRLSELFIKASTFLYSATGHPKIAFLYQTRSDVADSKLAIYRLTGDDKDSTASRFDPNKDRELLYDIEDPGAAILIPVPRPEVEKRYNVRNPTAARAQLGGVIVVGETRLWYFDEVTKAVVKGGLTAATIFVAWAQYDDTHYFLADDYGKMHFLTIHTDGVEVTGLEVIKIGVTSRASCLVYLNDNILFVGSHYGDSQLWRIDLGEDATEYLQLIQILPNIGPILDFAIMDMGNREGDSQLGNAYSSGQARLVTGSGAHKDGSLRSVRSGVGLEDVGILGDLEDVRGLFSVRSQQSSQKVDTLVASFLTETRVFKFDAAGEVEELEAFEGLSLEHQTLLAVDLVNGRRLQVTTAATILIDSESGVSVANWTPSAGSTITAASANPKWALIAVDGKYLVSFNLEKDLSVSEKKDVGDNDQVACVHAAPQLLDVGVVGFWAGTISIVDLATLQPHKGQSLRQTDDNASIPRDLALAQVLPHGVGGPTVFVSMEDGNVITFNISTTDFALSGRHSVILGTQQARFHLLPQPDGISNIFATTEHPSLIYGSEGRIVYSAVTAEDATYVCAFDTEAYPNSVVVATQSNIKISQIDTERRTHVRPLEMGETIRRIAYSPKEQVFGLGCIKRELLHGEEIVSSSFKLVDEIIFDKLGKSFPLEDTTAVEMVECVIRATLPDCYGNLTERFLVGTSYLTENDVASSQDDVRGRLLVLGVDSERSPYLIMSHRFKGACRCLAVMDDMIVTGLTKTVVVGKYIEESSTSGKLTRIASYRPATFPVDLAVEGNIIAVADLMKSISLVEFSPAKDGKPPMLTEVARHYQSAWSTAISHLEDLSWLEADAQGNLMVLRRNPGGVTVEDKRRLEMTSEMNLGEMVNRIRKVVVETSPNATVVPKAFLGTVEGSIYLFGTVAPHAQDLLMRFQSNLAQVVQTPGNINFASYRAFRNAEREGEAPFRFLDGELLERFLDMDEATQGQICQGLGPSVEDLRNIVEELKRMH